MLGVQVGGGAAGKKGRGCDEQHRDAGRGTLHAFIASWMRSRAALAASRSTSASDQFLPGLVDDVFGGTLDVAGVGQSLLESLHRLGALGDLRGKSILLDIEVHGTEAGGALDGMAFKHDRPGSLGSVLVVLDRLDHQHGLHGVGSMIDEFPHCGGHEEVDSIARSQALVCAGATNLVDQ